MKISRILAALPLFLSSSVFLYAGNSTTGTDFLLENPSPRQVAMGGIQSVAAEGTDAIHSNPAGLGAPFRPELNFSYAAQQDTGSHGFAGYAHPILRRENLTLGIGAGLIYYTAGNIDINFSNGTPSRSLNAETSYAGSAAIGARIGKWLSLGAAPKYIKSTLVEQYSANAAALDAGAMIYPFPDLLGSRISVGGLIQNLGPKISYKSAEQDLPQTASGGIAARLYEHAEYGAFLAAAQIEQQTGEKSRSRLGIEYSFGSPTSERAFALRGGYRFGFDIADYSLGFGLREKNVEVNYAFANATTLDRTHRVNLVFRFGAYNEKRKELIILDEEMSGKQEKHRLIDEKKMKDGDDGFRDVEKSLKRDRSKRMLDEKSGASEKNVLIKEEKKSEEYELLKETE